MAMGQQENPWGPQVLIYFFLLPIGFFGYLFLIHSHIEKQNRSAYTMKYTSEWIDMVRMHWRTFLWVPSVTFFPTPFGKDYSKRLIFLERL